ncbi:MAG TPA: hypothetical protein VNL91_00070, partial [Thermoanaerobaculia bacterium]|nr:hypothetical protein [Thermoanaerobaculia bacterium]
PMFSSRYETGRRDLDASAAKLAANLGERQNVDASYFSTAAQALTVPSTFLSLRYSGIVSERMFFHATVSRQRAD